MLFKKGFMLGCVVWLSTRLSLGLLNVRLAMRRRLHRPALHFRSTVQLMQLICLLLLLLFRVVRFRRLWRKSETTNDALNVAVFDRILPPGEN